MDPSGRSRGDGLPSHEGEAIPWQELEAALGITFSNRELLREALTHTSYSYERGASRFPSNERLEFLGDAVVNLAAVDLIWQLLPGEPEGVLSRHKAVLVSREVLASRARAVGLDRYLLLGAGEDRSGGRKRPSLLADAFEAVVGALYLEAGWEAAKAFVQAQLEEEFRRRQKDMGESLLGWVDAKSQLQELVQARGGEPPEYRLVSVEGPPHRRRFHVTVGWRGRVWGRGTGTSRRDAEQDAARKALQRLRKPSRDVPEEA